MKHASIAAVLMIAMSLAGCAGASNESIKGLSQDDADRLNNSRSRFDSNKDPAFTAPTRFAAGQLAESQGAPQVAVEQYKEALRLDPRHQPSLYRLGVIYTQLKMYPQAIEAWKQYVTVTNESAEAYGNLGFCCDLAGRRREAEEAYRKGIERDGKCVPCRVNYGLMLVRSDRADEALAQLQAVLTPAQAHYNIGSAYEQMGKRELARHEYAKALELEPAMNEAQVRMVALK
jgi:tetratricopeptide (TPR) repeat protein